METKRFIQPHRESGFALLMALIVVGVLISIGLTVLELSIKQVELSTNARDSEIAFNAANAGLECSRYTRRVSSTTMETGGQITPRCFQVAANEGGGDVSSQQVTSGVSGVSGGAGEVYLYNYSFTWGNPTVDRCTEITTLVASSTSTTSPGAMLRIDNVRNMVPGFTDANDRVDCEAGARCTVISVRGYNKTCSATSTFGAVQREVLLQF